VKYRTLDDSIVSWMPDMAPDRLDKYFTIDEVVFAEISRWIPLRLKKFLKLASLLRSATSLRIVTGSRAMKTTRFGDSSSEDSSAVLSAAGSFSGYWWAACCATVPLKPAFPVNQTLCRPKRAGELCFAVRAGAHDLRALIGGRAMRRGNGSVFRDGL
jgi:hypothetical protein